MKNKLPKAAWSLGVLLMLFCAFVYVAHVQSKSPLEEYKAKLRASGEKLAIEDWIPPRVPAEQNSAELMRQVMRLRPTSGDFVADRLPPAMKMVAPGKAMIGWRQPDVRSEAGIKETTNTWEELDAALALRNDELELLHKIVERPVLDFELDYKKGFKMLLPHLAPMKGSAQFLFAAAICDLHRGDTASAVTNTRAMLVLAKGLRGEPTLISQLVAIAITAIATTPTWELLQSTNVTDEPLLALQREWESLDFIPAAKAAFERERAVAFTMGPEVRAARDPLKLYSYAAIFGSSGSSGGGSGDWWEEIGETAKEAWNGARHQTALAIWRTSTSYTDELRMLQGEQVLIETFRQLQTNRNFRAARGEQDRKLNSLGLSKSSRVDWLFQKLDMGELSRLMSSSVDSLQGIVRREMVIETERQIVVTAIALKRFQLRHGNLPPGLSAMVPEFLSEVPHDPVDDMPLRYQKNSDGTFLLYSVGEDGIDDGGDATPLKGKSLSWERGRDWVWPQPASEKEVQAYYATNSVTR